MIVLILYAVGVYVCGLWGIMEWSFNNPPTSKREALKGILAVLFWPIAGLLALGRAWNGLADE